MEPYLKTYLLSVYSYEDDLLIKHRNILIKKLRIFYKENPIFGRKIITTRIRMLYYISCLYHIEKMTLFIPHNVHVPKTSLIVLEDKCYYVDYIEHNESTLFPDYNNNKKYKPYRPGPTSISTLLKKFVFTHEQTTILMEKYYPIVEEKLHRVDNVPRNTLLHNTDSDSDSDSDSDTDTDIGSNIIADADLNMDMDMYMDMDMDMESSIDEDANACLLYTSPSPRD